MTTSFSLPLGHRYWIRAIVGLCLMMAGLNLANGQSVTNDKYKQPDKFRQLEETLPTPSVYRSATGEPGPDYWQQRVDSFRSTACMLCWPAKPLMAA